MPNQPTYRSILVVDVESSGQRDGVQKTHMRHDLYDALMVAFARAGIRWDTCVLEDRGDGVYLLVSPAVPKPTLASRFISALDGVLAQPRLNAVNLD
ncbi:MAG: hypothetical protein JXA67_02000 [Micromonosporaceae bacterium]|nr:hypothetical protein [Micromonosporaceae bacterium]